MAEQVEVVDMEETGLEKVKPEGVVMRLTVDDLVERRKVVHEAMRRAMVGPTDERPEGLHFGPAFPGSKKNVLLQPGADMLNSLFMLRPEFKIVKATNEEDFIRYMVQCKLYHLSTGNEVGEGWGSCSSWEKKYRYRSESSGVEVPKNYWDTKDPKILEEASGLKGRLVARKQFTEGGGRKKWIIFQEIPNEDIYEQDNTMLKIACKRAKAAATVQATASSDIFVPEGESGDESQGDQPRKTYRKPRQKAPEHASERETQSSKGKGKAKTGNGPLDAMWAACHRKSISDQEVEDFYRNALGVQHAKDLTIDHINSILEWSDNPCPPEEWLINRSHREPGQEG